MSYCGRTTTRRGGRESAGPRVPGVASHTSPPLCCAPVSPTHVPNTPSAIHKKSKTIMYNMFVIQASMMYEPTVVGCPPHVDGCLSKSIQHAFECMSPIADTDAAIKVSKIPGRLIVTTASENLCELGNMSSATAEAVRSMEHYARQTSSIFAEYLGLCVTYELCLNKYLRS
jgi:hypothetical protein